MFYQEALLKFCVSIACLQVERDTGERHWRGAATFQKAESANSLLFVAPFYVGAHFCMGAYKPNVVVVIKIGAYIHGVLILCECLLS